MLDLSSTDLIIPARFCGPPSSGNGGWSAGALASLMHDPSPSPGTGQWPTIEVTLRKPPPLDAPMSVHAEEDRAVATFDGHSVLSARFAADATVTPVEQVSPEQARAAESSYAGLAAHPFPTCFACGTGRDEGDGLRIFPGVVDQKDGLARVAATWVPHPSVGDDSTTEPGDHPRASLANTWAALDCIGGWAGDIGERLMVLGRMTAAVDALPVIGEQHVVVGQGRGQEGRKTFTSSTLYDADGRIVARADHIWIAIDPADFA